MWKPQIFYNLAWKSYTFISAISYLLHKLAFLNIGENKSMNTRNKEKKYNFQRDYFHNCLVQKLYISKIIVRISQYFPEG